MNGEVEFKWEVRVDEMRLEQKSEFKSLGCVLDNQVQMRKGIVGWWRVGEVLLGPWLMLRVCSFSD